MHFLGKIIYVPIIWLLFELLYLGFNEVMIYYVQLGPIWIIALYFLLGTLMLGLLGVASEALVHISTYLTADKKFIFWTITIISVVFALIKIYNTWFKDVDYEGLVLLAAIAVTAWTFNLTCAFISGALKGKEESDF